MDTPNRRDFSLDSDDTVYLEGLGLVWETWSADVRFVIIRGWQLPPGYNVSHTDVALILQPNYPDVQIDMAYYCPALARADGKGIRALTDRSIEGVVWQQWSRHRLHPNVEWRSGVDNIASHLAYMDSWLREELTK
jgi:hypothetical protein